jgi:hypothetical protein
MAGISMDVVIGQLVGVLREGFEGLLGTLARLTAAEASRPVGGSSVAAHAHHVVFGLAASAAWVRGDRSPSNWQESWGAGTVDDAAWARLQEQLRGGYQELRQAIESHAASSLEAMGGAVGALTHVAYHLGAIRQKIAFGRQP